MIKTITIYKSRISYPSIFKKASFEGQTTNYRASFLISKKDINTVNLVQKDIDKLLTQKNLTIPSKNRCFQDGDLKYKQRLEDGYPEEKSKELIGNWVLTASNQNKPQVLNSTLEPLSEEDGVIYAGCLVNAIVSFYVSKKTPKNPIQRVCANLHKVQFAGHGEAFGGEVVIENDFEVLDLADEI